MNVSIMDIRRAILKIIKGVYPYGYVLKAGHYSVEDIADQIVFELIKENYKKKAQRKPVMQYINEHDPDLDSNRKYTRATQYMQYYRMLSNDRIEKEYGLRLDELETPDMSGSNRFQGYKITGQEFWMLKMHAECKIFDKFLHGQLTKSKNVTDTQFKELFDQYADYIDVISPMVNDPDDVIEKVFLYFGLEEYFNIDFIFAGVLEAEEHGFPKIIPADRIKAVFAMRPYMPENDWCPRLFCATNTMLMHRNEYWKNIFGDNDSDWQGYELTLEDAFRLKNILLQSAKLENLIDMVSQCSVKEQAEFIIERYWVYDVRDDYEWTPKRINYYRSLVKELTPPIPKPSIK